MSVLELFKSVQESHNELGVTFEELAKKVLELQRVEKEQIKVIEELRLRVEKQRETIVRIQSEEKNKIAECEKIEKVRVKKEVELREFDVVERAPIAHEFRTQVKVVKSEEIREFKSENRKRKPQDCLQAYKKQKTLESFYLIPVKFNESTRPTQPKKTCTKSAMVNQNIIIDSEGFRLLNVKKGIEKDFSKLSYL